jgi:hypothetical protein
MKVTKVQNKKDVLKTNGSKTNAINKNGKLPSAKTLLKNYTPEEIVDMFTVNQMADIFNGSQLLSMVMQLRENYETKNKKSKRSA